MGMKVNYNAKSDILVKHPVHGEYLAENVMDKMEAAVTAARKWGMQWSVLAMEATFERRPLKNEVEDHCITV